MCPSRTVGAHDIHATTDAYQCFFFLVTDLFITIFDAVLSSKAIGHGREGFYFGENGEHKLYDIGKRISEELVELAKIGTPEPTTFTDEECQKYPGVSAHFVT